MVPTPVEHHESNRHFYDRISRAYDLLADANEKAARQAGVKALHVCPGESVLELGFGTGNEVLELADLVGSSGRVAGIDISSGMLEVAKEKLTARKPLASVELTIGDARDLPYEDSIFDAVYTSFTLELFPDEDIPRVLSEVRRVLKPKGRLGIVSMAQVQPGDRSSFLEKVYIWMHRHFPHLVDCRPIQPVQLLTTAGFCVQSQEELKIWTMPVAVVVASK